MLHIHCLIWLKGNIGFPSFGERVLADPCYTQKIIDYMHNIIRSTIDEAIFLFGVVDDGMEHSFVYCLELDSEFVRTSGE